MYPRQLQVCTAVCTLNPKRKLKRAAELKDRIGEWRGGRGGQEEAGRGSELMAGWIPWRTKPRQLQYSYEPQPPFLYV